MLLTAALPFSGPGDEMPSSGLAGPLSSTMAVHCTAMELAVASARWDDPAVA
jgi:hypothetical protein